MHDGISWLINLLDGATNMIDLVDISLFKHYQLLPSYFTVNTIMVKKDEANKNRP